MPGPGPAAPGAAGRAQKAPGRGRCPTAGTQPCSEGLSVMGSGRPEVYGRHQCAPGPDRLPLPCGQEGARDLPGSATHQQVSLALTPAAPLLPSLLGHYLPATPPPPFAIPAPPPRALLRVGVVSGAAVPEGQPGPLPTPPRQVPDLPPGGDHPHCGECCGRAQRVIAVPPHTLHGPPGPPGKAPPCLLHSSCLVHSHAPSSAPLSYSHSSPATFSSKFALCVS